MPSFPLRSSLLVSLCLSVVIGKTRVSLSELGDRNAWDQRANTHFNAVRGFTLPSADISWKSILGSAPLRLAKTVWQICSQLGQEGQGCFETLHLPFTVHFRRSCLQGMVALSFLLVSWLAVLLDTHPRGWIPEGSRGAGPSSSPTWPDRAAERHSGRPGLEHCLH